MLLRENRLLRGAFTASRLDAVQLIAGQLAVSLDNAQLYAEFRQVASEQAALRRVATVVARAAPPEDVFAAVAAEVGGLLGVDVDHAVAEAAGALDELSEIARGIHPAILAERGLAPALRALARRSPIPVDLQVHVNKSLPEPVEVSAYYVIAEALTNTAKHARASTVSVQIEAVGDFMLLAVDDDGAGGAGFTGGTGLAGLKDRVEALGGRIILDSPHGEGTSLRVQLPLTPRPNASLPLQRDSPR